MGRAAAGTRGIRLRKGDIVKGMDVVRNPKVKDLSGNRKRLWQNNGAEEF